ncbi:MAG: type III-A CRISPR-associated RAMP protein Csm5 [Desulfobacterales bacterium]|nr:type III-A CRISPR-associated RAMP protein Csm5 [Desulfobacterales bacterium]
MNNFKDTFHCMLKVVAPLHLGCDEVYEPMGFVVDEENNQLRVFDPIDFISGLSDEDRSRFSGICKTGNVDSILEIFKFLNGRKVQGRPIDLCGSFVAHYKKILGIRANEREILTNLNQFQISRTAFKPSDDRPYIPGSAIKGAIRTAYLNTQNKKKQLPKSKQRGKELENELLENRSGKIEGDPFRLLKVSDFMPVGNSRTKIVYAVNKKKKESPKEANGPYQILEVIEPGAVFTGQIAVEKLQSDRFIRQPLDLGQLLASLVGFYGDENARECAELNGIGVDGIALEKCNSAIPLRLGRHSGAESLTIKGHRNILIRLGGNKITYLNKATTVWLSSETEKGQNKKALRPFGWVQLEKLTDESEKTNQLEELQYISEKQEALKKRAEKIAFIKEEEEREIRDVEKRAKETEEARMAEEKRQAELAAMGPEEKDIATLKSPDVIENTVVEIYYRIDHFSDNNKIQAALAIKAYWQKNNKWEKKACSRKQQEKVQKIKSMLAD